jgi:hypothetical protein
LIARNVAFTFEATILVKGVWSAWFIPNESVGNTTKAVKKVPLPVSQTGSDFF